MWGQRGVGKSRDRVGITEELGRAQGQELGRAGIRVGKDTEELERGGTGVGKDRFGLGSGLGLGRVQGRCGFGWVWGAGMCVCFGEVSVCVYFRGVVFILGGSVCLGLRLLVHLGLGRSGCVCLAGFWGVNVCVFGEVGGSVC